ncbi:YVTN family beta-propeller protein [Dongia mobilis]|uniref:YVTN family beta-propeller protein n=1 Tax=Dongia mobilis TaxID=578943 RepID=A0A4R6WF42_9PROT|nr:YncE family protein [Dongia mobilis]TDQ78446.1 YVTN family beta-propeller protein [Dongia mobilis]
MKKIPSDSLGSKAVTLRLPIERSRQFWLTVLAATFLTISGVTVAQTQITHWKAGTFVYTADEHGNSISAIDLATGSVTTTPVPISPHNVQITADGSRILAVGEPAADGHGHGHGGTDEGHGATEAKGFLLVFDATALGLEPIAKIPVGTHPAHVVVEQSGARAFVTNAGDNSVSVIDLATKALIANIDTGRYPHGIRMSPDGREIYVANVEDGTLSVIDAKGLTEIARIPVGNTPVQVGFTPDGSWVYVSLREENRVAVVDTSTRNLIGSIEVGRNPIQVYATPDGRSVYVANQGSADEPADTVSVIDVASRTVVNTIRTGMGAHGVVVADDSDWAFVTNIMDGTVSAIEVATGNVIASFPVGRGPNGITYRSPKQ